MGGKQVSLDAQDSLIASLSGEKPTKDLEDRDKAMLQYAVKLTRTPNKIIGSDIELLKEVDFDDRAIHDICAIVAYFNFVNRMASGLGIELEDRFSH